MSDYISEMRKLIEHRPLMCTACGVIIENENNEILLQKRADNGYWGIPGGSMNIGETFLETAQREVFEETGLSVYDLKLFGIYSGKDCIIEYPNKDVCCVTAIIFITSSFKGELLQITDETKENKFFDKTNLPLNINAFDKKYIEQWKNGATHIFIS